MDYRLCLLDADGNVSRTEEFRCFNDFQAIERLAKFQHDHEVELWARTKRIASRPAPATSRVMS
jgi:hypothetical protein